MDTLRNTIKDFLNGHRKAVFATIDAQGFPVTSLMLYAIDEDFNVYFGTRRSFSRYTDIRHEPIISLTIVEESLDPLRVVDIRGTAIEVPDEECGTTCSFFKTKNPAKYYIEEAEDFVMFKLVPTFIRMVDSTSGEIKIFDLPITIPPLEV